jgi:hypothetical protein
MRSGRILILSVMATVLIVAISIAALSLVGTPSAKAQGYGPASGPPQAMGPDPGMQPGGARPEAVGTIAATSDYVYVLRGNVLYQFSPQGLTLSAQYEFPRPQGTGTGRGTRGTTGTGPAQ